MISSFDFPILAPEWAEHWDGDCKRPSLVVAEVVGVVLSAKLALLLAWPRVQLLLEGPSCVVVACHAFLDAYLEEACLGVASYGEACQAFHEAA